MKNMIKEEQNYRDLLTRAEFEAELRKGKPLRSH